MRRTVVKEASVRAKSSRGCSSAFRREENKGRGGLQLTPETDPRSGMEWHEARANFGELGVFPECRVKERGIGAVEVGVPVHVVD